MHAAIAEKKEEIAEICRRYRVSRLEVFGSAARGGDFDPERSDADFLYQFQPPLHPGIFRRYMGLIRDLEATLGRDVDIVEIGSVGNRHLRELIDRSRELVYDSAE